MPILQAIPMTVIPLILFNAIALLSGGNPWADELFAATLPSGGRWIFSLGDLMIVAGIVFLFIEILNSSRPSRNTITNHVISTVVLIVYIIEFILADIAANSVFFVLTIISLFDVIAGFTVTIKSATRDINFGQSMDGGMH